MKKALIACVVVALVVIVVPLLRKTESPEVATVKSALEVSTTMQAQLGTQVAAASQAVEPLPATDVSEDATVSDSPTVTVSEDEQAQHLLNAYNSILEQLKLQLEAQPMN